MPDFVLETNVTAPPERVFQALTEPSELTAWWTPEIVAEPRAGTLLQASFRGGAFVIVVEVAALTPARQVEWIPRRGAPPQWQGTRITWALSPSAGGTRLVFAQRGFTAAGPDGALPGAGGWTFYCASLKDYLETGHGRPGAFVER